MSLLKRMDWILSNQGIASRKEVKKLLKENNVVVDGNVIRDPAFKVNPLESEIVVCGQSLNYREFVYIMLHKPPGVISATYDNKHKTVIDILPEMFQRFNPFPVGRLDIDTEGLLLLTNDGTLAHNLLSPKKHVPKKYFVIVDDIIDSSLVKEFEKGVMLEDGYQTLPSVLEIEDDHKSAHIVISEGKFHQIKRMFLAFGNKVRYLKRIQMGPLVLDERLPLGEFRELEDTEVKALKKIYSMTEE